MKQWSGFGATDLTGRIKAPMESGPESGGLPTQEALDTAFPFLQFMRVLEGTVTGTLIYKPLLYLEAGDGIEPT